MDIYLKWTWVNWITVVLMVTIAYLAFGFVGKAIQQASGTG